MSPTTGLLALKTGGKHYSLSFPSHGWLAAEMIQYLEDILGAEHKETAILKLLGFTLHISLEAPPRRVHHWVVVDLDQRVLESNCDLVRLAVDQKQPPPDSPYNPMSLRRIHSVLDRHNFTVKLYR
jgi:hypothetical protein